MKIGLVLTGGGARGAYQSGAVRYLAEQGFCPHIIAGTSIGALNGAVLASHPSFVDAAFHLEDLWDQLGQADVIKINKATVVKMASDFATTFTQQLNSWAFKLFVRQGFLKHANAFFDVVPIEKLLRQMVNAEQLRRGIELWATVFPSLHIPGFIEYHWIFNGLIDAFRAYTGVKSHWIKAQDCEDDTVLYKLLLASAAIPFAFPKQIVNGTGYVDGGLADNVPVRALSARDCNVAIIIHLSNGSVFNRHDFPGMSIIEIRPEQSMIRSHMPVAGEISSILDFSPQRIHELKQQGYEDSERCLQPILEAAATICRQQYEQEKLIDSTVKLFNDTPL